MAFNYLTFKKFNDIGLATEIGEHLRANGIEYLIEDTNTFFDASFANNSLDPNINLKIKAEDFESAYNILQNVYKQEITSVDKDYYLFEFSDAELLEIISKPDEWGEFDYQLAQKILIDRGKEIKPEIVELLTEQRAKELLKPETINYNLIYRRYFSALFRGSILFGHNLAYSKKTMRNGKQVYSYRKEERKHGKRILIMAVVSLIIWAIVIIYVKSQL